jgi:Protein of unknown function (DUF3592)
MLQVLYTVLLIIGLILSFYAFQHFKKTQNLLNEGIQVEATVIRLIEIHDDGTTYKPVFSFYDLSNKQREFESPVSSSPPAYQEGEIVQLTYDPNDESNVKVIGFWGLYRWTIILLSIASPLIVIGGGYFLYIYSHKN